ncbi:hypothetical protein M569_16961, partial [Genlisea aurea]
MSKRFANLLEAVMPPPPSLDAFLAIVRECHRTLSVSADPDPVTGVTFSVRKPGGTEQVSRAALRSLVQFADLCADTSANYATLDAFLVGWGRWVIPPGMLFDDEAEASACAQRTKELAAQHGIRVQVQPPMSFRTYVNAIARVYKNAAPDTVIIPSSQRQFPLFNQFFASAVQRDRARRAVATVTHPRPTILQVEEFRAVMASADLADPFQGQRANILALAFCSGFRCEVLRRLVVGRNKVSLVPIARVCTTGFVRIWHVCREAAVCNLGCVTVAVRLASRFVIIGVGGCCAVPKPLLMQ